jgi:hypothetical protein
MNHNDSFRSIVFVIQENVCMENKLFTCARAKEVDLVDYLFSLGYRPTKIRNNDYWYLSPLRHESKASFKINRKLNAWYDFGLGKGGDLIDFGIL